jgi:pimeloyl-ACP methyl ester carboxylesterase
MPLIEINGAELYYELRGAGRPAFVFVHGGMCNHEDWAHQVKSLSRSYTVLTLDLRGHGRSSGAFEDCHIGQWAADVNALIDALGLSPVVLTGHSLGARIAVEAAWRRPDSIGAIVLLDGSRMYGGFSTPESRDSRIGGAPAAQPLLKVLDATIGAHADPATRAYLLQSMSSAPPALMQAAVDAIQAWDLHSADTAFAELRPGLAVLLIQSTYHDRFTPRYSLTQGAKTTPYLDSVKAARPDVSIKILTDVGHFSMLERRDEITAMIRDFGIAALPR